ncbi:DUF2235 domain-containing protein [Burkholderia sp. BCC1988]|uniref:T6SS phospholipase effector Tle1-like catalytic domain-containing protein n=1 Tax=Burkholderia sp. BCC1988 TaxID=2817443 RepID=UPI002AAF7B3A|nr:DUF2235 domain-containing protein [Burkholderia sp. BCC1988]
MSLVWPEKMPATGRVTKKESDDAWATGICRVTDPTMSCPQTLHITLFFDGTNNNDAEDNNIWRDSIKKAHTNVARLFNAAVDDSRNGIFKYYIPGVGTPFPQIHETGYSSMGKAMAAGFSARCVWGYTRVLNAVYTALGKDKTRELLSVDDARRLSIAGADGNMTGFNPYLKQLGGAMKDAVDDSAWPRTVKQIWINVIGFSRGAAGARAFVHRLINEWAPGGKLGDNAGKYALPYTINFMGLFDTVASVGPPDSTRVALNVSDFAGHDAFASGGAMAIPVEVKACVHAFSIHEQRMSFPLDSIRKGDNYLGDIRHEIGYPGVHSDVGGGYAPGEQGKACDDKGQGDDSRKLSQIPLHDMYIAALKYGVPLKRADAINKNDDLKKDFALAPSTIAAFNAWLGTKPSVMRIEDVITFGMGQLLSWRTLRAQIGTADYVTEQPFFKRAKEDPKNPEQVAFGVDEATKTDPQMQELNTQLQQAEQQKREAMGGAERRYDWFGVTAAESQISSIKAAKTKRTEELCGQVAHPDAKPGPNDPPNSARPGETAYDVGTNDQTDLRQGAEEMRLLLGHLYPDELQRWQVHATAQPGPHAVREDVLPSPSPQLSVAHDGIRDDPRGRASLKVRLVDGVMLNTVRTVGLRSYDVADDVVLQPVEKARSFLLQHASLEAARQLPDAAIKLFDDYVHDSRCWFRVPYFHEYAPGGYLWPRVVFIGDDKRASLLGFDPLLVALNEANAAPQETEVA